MEFIASWNYRELNEIEMSQASPDSAIDEALKDQILHAAKQAYQNVRNCWSGEECFSCALMHDFFESLIHLHSPEVTQILAAKIRQQLRRTPSGVSTRSSPVCMNKFCYSFDSAQWKNSQKSAVLSILEAVLAMMMESSCKSVRPSERNEALLDLQYEISCCCSKCKASSNPQSARSIQLSPAAEQPEYNSLKLIEECLRCPNAQKQHESTKIDKIFELLKEERKQQAEAKIAQKQRSNFIYGLYGSLLGLEKEKPVDQVHFEQLEQRKEKIYEELLKKNSNNQRIIRRFVRKASLQRNQQKIARLSSTDITASTPLTTSKPKFKLESLTASVPLSSSRILKPRVSRIAVEPMGSIQQCITHYSRMQDRVEKALKNYEPREEKRTSILKSIVLNASDMFTERRPARPSFGRLDKVIKTSRDMRLGSRVTPELVSRA